MQQTLSRKKELERVLVFRTDGGKDDKEFFPHEEFTGMKITVPALQYNLKNTGRMLVNSVLNFRYTAGELPR